MKLTSLSQEVFACYSRSCAPPPVGKGGSGGGGRGGPAGAASAAKSLTAKYGSRSAGAKGSAQTRVQAAAKQTSAAGKAAADRWAKGETNRPAASSSGGKAVGPRGSFHPEANSKIALNGKWGARYRQGTQAAGETLRVSGFSGDVTKTKGGYQAAYSPGGAKKLTRKFKTHEEARARVQAEAKKYVGSERFSRWVNRTTDPRILKSMEETLKWAAEK